ncbi:MAG: pilus assembly protein, partial [Pseudobdellovibrionaceae bacterium]
LISGYVWSQEIILKPGETKTLPAFGKAWVEKSKVIQLSDTGRGFVVRGVKPGTSLLKIGSKSFDVSVLSPSQEKAWRKLERVVQKTLNLQLTLSDGQIRVQGHLVRWMDWETLYRACKNSDCDYVMEVSMKDSLRNFAQKKIGDLFQQHGLPPQNLMFDQQIQALVSDKGEVSVRVTRLLKALGIYPIATATNLDLVPMVRVQITVAEVRKSEVLNYGIKWPESYSAQILPNYAAGTTAQFLDVHFLEEKGLAKVLASPNILCRSGKEANFFAGGEFPIKILNYKIQDVVWKKYGIVMKVKPVADFSGKMSISIETEVSSIDGSKTADGVPGLFTNKIQSHFELNGPRTIALSGLIKSDQSEKGSGLPGLSRIPILGSLFSSKEFKDNRTELVVFVKPEVISPGMLEASR